MATQIDRWADPLKRAAVTHVKPRVGQARWDRLRRIARQGEPDPAELRRRRRAAMSLSELAVEFGTDKFSEIHRYTPHYERHLAHLRDEEFVLLELGIGGYRRERDGGASLRMWKHFFPKATIVGLDIEDKRFVRAPRIVPFQGSQDDPDVIARIFDEVGVPKVVIDDGSHQVRHVLESFRIIFPQLPDDAIYAIEDIQSSYWPDWGGSEDLLSTETSMALVKRLLDGLNHEEFLSATYEPTYTDRHVVGLHAYHNLVVIEKGTNDEGSLKRAANRSWYERHATD